MPLSIVGTPIGNLEDITLRAIRTLREAELILCEDTRRTRQLLTHLEITGKELFAYHAYNEHGKTQWVIDRLSTGSAIALVTDAGMPAIADPGFFLIRAAYEAGFTPVIIPGVSACTFAVAACGLPVNAFRFMAFIPVKSGRRTAFLEKVKLSPETVIFYESPHRIEKLIAQMRDVFGPDRKIAIIREATKLHEEVIRGTTQEVCEQTQNRNLKGEFTVAVCGTQEELPEEEQTNDYD